MWCQGLDKVHKKKIIFCLFNKLYYTLWSERLEGSKIFSIYVYLLNKLNQCKLRKILKNLNFDEFKLSFYPFAESFV